MDRKFLRPGWIVGHLLVVLAVLVCLRLGRWQWDRMHEGGTLQNFGYAVLWPVFGAAFVYMWFRFLQLEKLKDAEDDAELTALAAGGHSLTDVEDDESDAVAPRVVGPLAEAQPEVPHAARTEGPPPPVQSADPGRVAADETTAHWSTDQTDDGHLPPTVRVSRTTPSTGVTVGIATVGDDDDDPELAAYNRALAALAEKDHRRAR